MDYNETVDSVLYNNNLFNLKWLNIEFSSACNLRCKWCAMNHDKKGEFITEEILTKLLYEINQDHRFSIDVIDLHNGGEILLDKKLEKKLNIIAKNKPTSQVNLLTNAVLLKKDVSHNIINSGAIDLIRFSVDGGSREHYEDIRRGALWDSVKTNITNFIELNRKNISTGIICIVPIDKPLSTEWMDTEFQELLNLVDDVELRYPHNWDGSKDIGITSTGKNKDNTKICKFLKYNLVLLPNGDVTVCCADLNSAGVIGNINDNDLADIFLSNKRIKMINKFLCKRMENIPLCSKCSGYYE